MIIHFKQKFKRNRFFNAQMQANNNFCFVEITGQTLSPLKNHHVNYNGYESNCTKMSAG